MDSTNQMEERTCFTCHNLCTNPVSLSCEHSYCRRCLEQVLDNQDKLQIYYCPFCSEKCQVRPLIKQAMIPPPCSEQVNCTYCGIPAKKTCVQCNSSFCALDLMKHPNLPGHTLIEPTQSLEDIKCSTHNEILKYYCRVDGSCICTSCWAIGDHRGHRVMVLNEFAEMKKNNLRPLIEKFQKDIEGAKKQIHSLHEYKRGEEQKADSTGMKVKAYLENIGTDLTKIQNKVLNDISKEKKLVSLSVSNQIKKLEKHTKLLSGQVERITQLCSMEDPLTFLINQKESNITGNYSDQYKAKHRIRISEKFYFQELHKKLLQFADGLIDHMLKNDFRKMKKSKITLDQETAHYCIAVRKHLREAFNTSKRQKREQKENRFRSCHIVSRFNFKSGIHYWEVDVGMMKCFIGVACQSMDRKTTAFRSRIGLNERSWSLCVDKVDNVLSAYHNGVKREIPTDSPKWSFGIFLEYKAGRLSFYQLCKPIRHLHTFTAIFTEPLYPAFYLDKGSSIVIRK